MWQGFLRLSGYQSGVSGSIWPHCAGPIPRRIKGLRISALSARASACARETTKILGFELLREPSTIPYLSDPLTPCRTASACLR
jgi:hypothetical protein